MRGAAAEVVRQQSDSIMRKVGNWMVYYLITMIVIGIDQLTKSLVVYYMEIGESIPLIDGVLHLTSHRNRGAAWGILQGQMWLFYIVTSLFIASLIYYLQKHPGANTAYRMGLTIILGGAVGNFIDRVFRKEVVDFIDTYIFSYDFPIFNIADSALWVGIAFIAVHELFINRKREKEHEVR